MPVKSLEEAQLLFADPHAIYQRVADRQAVMTPVQLEALFTPAMGKGLAREINRRVGIALIQEESVFEDLALRPVLVGTWLEWVLERYKLSREMIDAFLEGYIVEVQLRKMTPIEAASHIFNSYLLATELPSLQAFRLFAHSVSRLALPRPRMETLPMSMADIPPAPVSC